MIFIPAPGHSPGHTTVYFPKENILFTSDLGVGLFGPWYGFKDCDIYRYVESLLYLKALKPKLLLTGHGGVISKDIEGIFDRSIEAFFWRDMGINSGLIQNDEVEFYVGFNCLGPYAKISKIIKSQLDSRK